MTLNLTPPGSARLLILITTLDNLFSCIAPSRASISPPGSLSDNLERRHCDEDFCDSIVNICQQTRRCSCNFTNDSLCIKDCVDCLQEKFNKCCACVGLCPVQTDDINPSHVGDINPKIVDEQLFSTLTETDDIHGRWSVDSYTTGRKLLHPEYGQIEMVHRRNGNNETMVSMDEGLARQRCLLAFINRHLQLDQCKRYCTSMGASHFRWFHQGCCECIGKYCLQYGIHEPKCLIDID